MFETAGETAAVIVSLEGTMVAKSNGGLGLSAKAEEWHGRSENASITVGPAAAPAVALATEHGTVPPYPIAAVVASEAALEVAPKVAIWAADAIGTEATVLGADANEIAMSG